MRNLLKKKDSPLLLRQTAARSRIETNRSNGYRTNAKKGNTDRLLSTISLEKVANSDTPWRIRWSLIAKKASSASLTTVKKVKITKRIP